MKLVRLLDHIDYRILTSHAAIEEIEVGNIVFHSRSASENTVFVCIEGQQSDGHRYIDDAWKRGNRVFIVEKGPESYYEGGTYIKVESSRRTLAYMAAAYWGYPSRRLKIIGVTGTKGKTTFTELMAEVLERCGKKTATIGTLGIRIDGKRIPQKNTTPESFTIHRYFDKMVKAGCEYVVMEVSSQGLKQMRVEGIIFETAVFTNIGIDHIGTGEHPDFEDYRYWKSRLFHRCRTAVMNEDDTQCGYMFQNTKCDKYYYSCRPDKKKKSGDAERRICAENIAYGSDIDAGMMFKIGNEEYRMNMPGLYNVYNAMSVICVSRLLGLDKNIVKNVLEHACVSGRLERVKTKKKIACYVDYAHNALSMENVLQTFRAYEPYKIIVVFGCGGERSKDRRLLMGKVAGRYADLCVLTTDNPRNEDPQRIIRDIEEGIQSVKGRYLVEPDRAEAVKKAVQMAEEGTVVLVTGKGHERFQEIEGKIYAMDDRKLIQDADHIIESCD